ncbi:MAG: hypothetical protein H7Z14_19845, partial [Anaerolineae bacterium]|nr:hypothetical protein [Phycisphaerae bacterium]
MMSIAAAVGVASSSPFATAQAVDQLQTYFDSATAFAGNNMGGFDYQSANNSFWTVGFGAGQAIRQVTFNGATWTGTNIIGQTDWVGKFLASSSVSDNGGNGTILPPPYTAASTAGDFKLNPSPVTVGGITYPARTLAVVVDQATVRDTSLPTAQQPQPQYSKMIYTYDLRSVGSAAAPGSRDRNGNAVVDWNDPFTPLVTALDMQQAIALPPAPTIPLITRGFAFSSDGQSVYYNDSGTTYGGIWRASIADVGAGQTHPVARIVTSLTGTRINTEPTVVASAVRNFGGGTGDQIMFGGSTDNGNIGGINYVVDNAGSVSPVKTLLSSKQITAFNELPSTVAGIDSMTSDAGGNVYCYNGNNPTGVTVYATNGYLAKITSSAEERWFVNSKTGAIAFSASHLDFKTRDAIVPLTGGGTANLTQVLFNDNTLRTPVAITAYKVGDFDRNNTVDAADVSAFKAVLGLRGITAAGIVTTSNPVSFTANSPDKLKFDLNGSNVTSVTAGGNTTVTAAAIIDWKDVKIFQQFAGLSDCDVDMDFDVDTADLTTVATNYNTDGKLFTQGNLTSVRIANADKDAVNYADLVTLAANWTAANPNLSGFSAAVQADGDRAFALTAGGSRHQYIARGSGVWSNAANWSGGVPNSAGAVASLLTKPQDDVTLEVDGVFTIGQLNFDNFF